MIKHALILHAWYNHPANHWYPWLAKELGKKGYHVDMPELPTMNTALPDLAKQLQVAEKYISKDTVVIGHSLGALLAMHLAEKYELKKMILVAGWDFNDLTPEHKLYWKKPYDHEKIKQHVHETYCFSSDNDPYQTAFQVEEMSKRLGGKFILVKGAGHFTKKFGITTIPALLEII